MATFEQRRAEFGERLRQIREEAGLNGKEAAAQIGWNPPKVSKIEKGRQAMTSDDLEEWIAGLSVSAKVATQLRLELADLDAEHIAWKERLRAGHKARQEESALREARAKVIRAVDVGVVPGVLQNADYARYVLEAVAKLHGARDVDEGVKARMRRQQVLYEPGKTIEILMSYAALIHPIAPPDVMVGQIHRLIATIGIPNVRFGIIRPHTQLPYPLTHGYWIVDDLVMIEQTHGEVILHDPDEVNVYNQLTDMLWDHAAEGTEARELLMSVRAAS